MRIGVDGILGRFNKTKDIKNKEKSGKYTGRLPAKGQIIRGEIVDIKKQSVFVELEDGQNVEAKMLEKFNFVIGDRLKFLVKESNQELLLLSPQLDEDAEELRIADILKTANLKNTPENIELVKKLIEHNMPINKRTLTDMTMYMKRFPEAKIDHLIFLAKNDIIIAKESLRYVDALLSNKTNVSENISTFNKNVADIVDRKSGMLVVDTILKENEAATSVFSKVKNFFLQPEEQVEILRSKLDFPMAKLMTSEEAKALLDETSNLGGAVTREQEGKIYNNLEVNMKEIDFGAKEQLRPLPDDISQPLQTNKTPLNTFINENSKAFSELFESLEALELPEDVRSSANKLLAQRVTRSMLNNELMLKSEDFREVDQINRHYNKVYNRIMDVLNLEIQDTSDSVQKVLKEAVDIKSSVEIMNQLQQNYQFVHIPVLLNNQEVNSELYIMNKKKKASSKEDRITALIRLDLRNMGQLDIYVAKTGNNVDLTFYVENSETENQINAHTSKLAGKLAKEAFNVLGIGVLLRKETFKIDDFFNAGENSNAKRFTFDMRA